MVSCDKKNFIKKDISNILFNLSINTVNISKYYGGNNL